MTPEEILEKLHEKWDQLMAKAQHLLEVFNHTLDKISWLAGWIPTSPRTNELALSLTMALSQSSNSTLAAPARVAATARLRCTFWCMNAAT